MRFHALVFVLPIIASLSPAAHAHGDCPEVKPGWTEERDGEPVLGCPKVVKQCKEKPGKVKFALPEVGPPKVDHSLSLAQLQVLKVGKGGVETPGVKRGRTFSRVFVTVGQEIEVEKADGGDQHSYCGRVTSLTIGPTSVEIYVPKEFSEGTCVYRQTIAREMQHYEDTRAAVKEFNSGIDLFVGRLGPSFWAENPSNAKAIFEARVKNVVTEQRQVLRQKISNAVDNLDTDENYDKIEKACKGQWPN